jgi:hypothetical protein
MEMHMNRFFFRAACVLALSTSPGCADVYFSYVEDASLPMLVQDVGTMCDGDDVDEDIARVRVEQVGSDCVITADALVRVIEYQDVIDSLSGIALEDADWSDGGICTEPAQEDDVDEPWEKCDYGPMVTASWRPAGEDEWEPDPEFPAQATADIALSYYAGPVDSLDDVGGADPALTFSTSGQTFPTGGVEPVHAEFFDAFADAVPEDLYSVAHARVQVPMSDIAAFAEHEYRIEFAYQMYVQGVLQEQNMLELLFESLFGGGDQE